MLIKNAKWNIHSLLQLNVSSNKYHCIQDSAVGTLSQGAKVKKGAQAPPFFQAPVQSLYEKHFYFEMLITFEPNVAQRSVVSQNDQGQSPWSLQYSIYYV